MRSIYQIIMLLMVSTLAMAEQNKYSMMNDILDKKIEKDNVKNSKVVHLLSELSSTNEPGIQYVVVNSDSVVFEYSSGQADIKNKVALSSNHTMAAFSMTKTLTAIGILQLLERHKIKLDDKISLYVVNGVRAINKKIQLS